MTLDATTAARILINHLDGSWFAGLMVTDTVDGRTRYGMAIGTPDDEDGWIEILDGDDEPTIYWD